MWSTTRGSRDRGSIRRNIGERGRGVGIRESCPRGVGTEMRNRREVWCRKIPTEEASINPQKCHKKDGTTAKMKRNTPDPSGPLIDPDIILPLSSTEQSKKVEQPTESTTEASNQILFPTNRRVIVLLRATPVSPIWPTTVTSPVLLPSSPTRTQTNVPILWTGKHTNPTKILTTFDHTYFD